MLGASDSLPGRFESCFDALQTTSLAAWVSPLRRLTAERLQPARHGDLGAWIKALEDLPALPPAAVMLDQPCVGVAGEPPLSAASSVQLRQALEQLHPWRKGPFCLHGIEIDAEWRSDWKWARLADAIAPLVGRRVLDVGCGNGYYGFRALGAGADLVLGIDPTLRFVLQFLALEQLIGAKRMAVLPLADDDLPGLCSVAEGGFDTVFSMGVLYHRRDPAQHLSHLRRCLRQGGELVLETLVIDRPGERTFRPLPDTLRPDDAGWRLASKEGSREQSTSFDHQPNTEGRRQDLSDGASLDKGRLSPGGLGSEIPNLGSPKREIPNPGNPIIETLVPAGRYAQMRNVHAIPSISTLVDWIKASGYRRVQLVDLCRTTIQEQRSTAWMRFQSLADFLDPTDPSLTIEGHPAPVRALLLAQRAG